MSRDIPIIFSAPMIQALRADQKTQTRRLASSPLRRVQPGHRLWVRESFTRGTSLDEDQRPIGDMQTIYAADDFPYDRWWDADLDEWRDRPRWTPSIHMPRWASRLTLLVTEVRVQRLHDMNRGDAMAEGCPFQNMADGPNPRDWFRDLWDSLHGPGTWAKNPKVVALTFTVHQANIDALEAA